MSRNCNAARWAPVFLLFLAFPAFAQLSTGDTDFTQNYTLRTDPLGFGGAFRALADSNAAILYNPAGLAQRKGVFAAAGDYLHSGFSNSDAFGVSVTDYKATDILALGLEYDRDTFTSPAGNGVTAQQVTLAAAKDFASIFYAGLAVKGFLTQVDSPFLNGPDGVDMDLGLLVKPIPILSMALTAQNLIRGNDLEEFPFQLGFGVAATLEQVARLAIDVVRNFQTPANHNLNAYFGGELSILEGWCLRSGFGLDRIRESNFYSVGMAATGPRARFNFTFSQRLSPVSEVYAANLEFFL